MEFIKKQKYVLGFAFNKEQDCVILIEKQKPEFQKGLLNGLGGKIESGELDTIAMAREFKEECGVETSSLDWERFCLLQGTSFDVFVFKIVLTDEQFMVAETKEKEKIFKLPVAILKKKKCLKNLHWLIEAALDEDEEFMGCIGLYK